MDFKNVKCPLKMWAKHESMWHFLVVKFFGIVGFQIKIERIFSLVGIRTHLTR